LNGTADAEVLSWGVRSRLALLVLLVTSALSAALWSGLREQGIGEPEDRRKLMIVEQPGSDADYHAVLERGGFLIEVETFSDWEAQARAGLPDSEAQGVALLLEYADLRGFGFVVFEAPAQLDFSGLELEPSLDEIERLEEREHAVLSVGDLAFPHRLGVDELGDHPHVHMPGYGALEALFQQPALSAREDDSRPSVAELQYEAAIGPARRMYERPAAFTESIANAQATIDKALAADTDVRPLVEPFMTDSPASREARSAGDPAGRPSLDLRFTTGSAVPTPEGVLLVHHELVTFSGNALTLEQRPGETMQFGWLGDEALARVHERGMLGMEPCPSLAGGSIEMHLEPRIEAAVDGSALAIVMGEQVTVWRKLQEPGCTWEEHARLPSSTFARKTVVLAPRFPSGPDGREASSVVATLDVDDDARARVSLWSTPELTALELLRVPDATFGGLAFIDDRHLAVLAWTPLAPEEQTTTRRAEHALHLLDGRRPDAHLRIPAEFFAGGRSLRELAVVEPAVEGEHGPRLALTLVDNGVDTELVVLTIGAAAWQRFVEGEGEGEDESDPAALLFTLTPDELELREVGRAPAIAALAVGPGVLAHALAQGGVGAEIVVHPLDGGPERRLTHNDLVDTLPRFTADGRAVVFVTAVRSSLSSAPFSVPRIAWLPRE
jgi:hypothetical protein